MSNTNNYYSTVLSGNVGWKDGGNAVGARACPIGSYVDRIYGRSGGLTDQICMTCSDGTILGCMGGSGGNAYSDNTCDDHGFTEIDVTGDEILASIQPVCSNGTKLPQHGSTWDITSKMVCPSGNVIVGFQGREGNVVDKLNILCSTHPLYGCSDDINNPYCQNVINEGYSRDVTLAKKVISNYCSKNMNDQCKSYISSKPGEFDDVVQKWCATHLDDPFCSCYQPMPDDTPAELKILQSKPQCWNKNCNLSGYKNTNLRNDQSTCANIKVCNQNINSMQNTSTLNMNNLNVQDCSDKQNPGDTAASSITNQQTLEGVTQPVADAVLSSDSKSSNKNLMILIIIIAIVLAIYTQNAQKLKYQQYYQQQQQQYFV